MGQAWDEAFATIDPEAPLADQLLSAFGQVAGYHEREPRLARAFFKELLFVSPVIQADVTDFMRSFWQRLSGLLDQAQCNGKLDPKVPSIVLARNLFAQWYFLVQRRFNRETVDHDQLHAEMAQSFEVALWGLIPDRAGPGSVESS